MLLNNIKPIMYPAIPPITEDNVQINAKKKALILFAKTIGINIMSGGIGKNELSAKDTIQRNQGALL